MTPPRIKKIHFPEIMSFFFFFKVGGRHHYIDFYHDDFSKVSADLSFDGGLPEKNLSENEKF